MKGEEGCIKGNKYNKTYRSRVPQLTW